MSAWSGLRPLVRDPNNTDTKSLARNHIIEVAKSGLVTIAGTFGWFIWIYWLSGGKWTTYRHMAEETVDAAVKAHGLKPKTGCQTAGLRLEGFFLKIKREEEGRDFLSRRARLGPVDVHPPGPGLRH
jgi:glycerol-3-phosphate dehydrogenase